MNGIAKHTFLGYNYHINLLIWRYSMTIQESGEMYLETIYILSQRSANVRSIDVGAYMGYSKPSVSRAIGLLKKDGFVSVDEQGFLSLTEAGLKRALIIYERHRILRQLFMNIGVDEETATKDACRIEHYISEKTFEALKKHMAKYGSKDLS